MKRFLFIFLAVACCLAVQAQTRVVDPEGEPMVGTVVMDNDGDPVGIVDDNGMFPEVDSALYPLTFTCVGFERTTVAAPTAEVVMQPANRQLSEVVVRPGDHPAMYITCFIREVSNISNGTDSITYTSRCMADFMLPAFKGAKCKTWHTPRVLAEEEECRTTGPDMKLDDYPLKELSRWLIELAYRSFELPDSLKGRTQGVMSVLRGDGAELTYRLTPTSLSLVVDELASEKDHMYKMPWLFRLLGFSLTINESWDRCVYSFSENGTYNPSNLIAQSFSYKMTCEGKVWKRIFKSDKLPVTIYSYVEIYPVDVVYLTKDEAKELKKNKPECAIVIPEAALQ